MKHHHIKCNSNVVDRNPYNVSYRCKAPFAIYQTAIQTFPTYFEENSSNSVIEQPAATVDSDRTDHSNNSIHVNHASTDTSYGNLGRINLPKPTLLNIKQLTPYGTGILNWKIIIRVLYKGRLRKLKSKKSDTEVDVLDMLWTDIHNTVIKVNLR